MKTLNIQEDGSGDFATAQEAYDAAISMEGIVDIRLGKGSFGDIMLLEDLPSRITFTGEGIENSFLGRIYSQQDPGVNVHGSFDQMTVDEIDVGSIGGYGAKVSIEGACYIKTINARSYRSNGGHVTLGDGIKVDHIDVYGGEKAGSIQAGKNCELWKMTKDCGRFKNEEATVTLKEGTFIKPVI